MKGNPMNTPSVKHVDIRKLTTLALLIACEICLTRFLSIQTPIVRLGFGFLPVALMGILYGPAWAGLGAAVADLLGVFLFPTAAYFPGFTLTALLTGIVYGLAFYQKKMTIPRILAAVSIICIVLNLGLDTLWLYIITGNAYLALLAPRLVKCAIMIPVQVLLIYAVSSKRLVPLLDRARSRDTDFRHLQK